MNQPSMEIAALVFSVFWGIVHIMLASHSASWQRGYKWAASARDEALTPLTGVAGRLARASANYLETFPYFASLVLAIYVTGVEGSLPAIGIGFYIVGRVLFLPLYAVGVYLLRSLAWMLATVGIILLAIALLPLVRFW